MLSKGFRFGMLLQIAIGPVCIFIFQNSVALGLIPALQGVLGVALTDGTEIVLAILGAAILLDKRPKLKKAIGIISGAVVIFFGVNSILSATETVNLLPRLSENMFVAAFCLAASNPLTIIFWSGIFTSRIAAGDMNKEDMWVFGTGCVLSTLFFLSVVALVGSCTTMVIPSQLIKILNIVSGTAILAFGVKSIIKTIKVKD